MNIRSLLPALCMGFALLATAAPARTVIGPQDILVINDKGGNVLQMIGKRREFAASGKEVRIVGYCRSACTLLITLPNACLTRDAQVGFHAPRLPGTSIIPPGAGDLMGHFYRGEIRRKWLSDWQYSGQMQRMSAQEYHRLDPQARICGPRFRKR